MTAGQRNCYEAIKAEADKYSLDDALFAVRELIRDARNESNRSESFFEDAIHHIELARNWVARAVENAK